MIWDNSSYLWLLFLVPLIYAAYWFYSRYQVKKREKLFDERLVQQLRKNYWKTGDKVRLFSIMAAFTFFIIALAGPKIGTEVREIQRKGVNLLVALDLSRSMNAEDIRPSRLGKAKFEINRLVNRLQGDRVGLLVFTDEAFVQAPLTTDYSALRLFLDIANTDQMPTSGTNFTSALEKASEAFESVDQQDGVADVLLFIADGEHHGPEYNRAVRQLTDNGVTIFSVGIGTEQGGRIPLYNSQDEVIGYHRDSQGQAVTTILESSTMRDIAQSGNGEYYEIRSSSDNIEPFFSRLDELERGEFTTQEFADYKNRYQLMMIGGILFLIVGLFFPDSISDKKAILNKLNK